VSGEDLVACGGLALWILLVMYSLRADRAVRRKGRAAPAPWLEPRSIPNWYPPCPAPAEARKLTDFDEWDAAFAEAERQPKRVAGRYPMPVPRSARSIAIVEDLTERRDRLHPGRAAR
jgi:hypothetical protein